MTWGAAITVFLLSAAVAAYCAAKRRAGGGGRWLFGSVALAVLAAASLAYAALGAALVSGIR